MRPEAETTLSYLADFFNIVVFTAGSREYADAILNEIDPDNSIISLRLYREHCVKRNQFYIKDLQVINGLDLSKTVIIDNSIISYAF